MSDIEEEIHVLAAQIKEQYRWFTGKYLREGDSVRIARRLYNLGWRKTNV